MMHTVTPEEKKYCSFVQHWLALEARLYTIILS